MILVIYKSIILMKNSKTISTKKVKRTTYLILFYYNLFYNNLTNKANSNNFSVA